MRNEQNRSVGNILENEGVSNVARFGTCSPEHTFLCRLRVRRSCTATSETLCCIASGPNHADSYPYRMMRADGTAAGSMAASDSQLTQHGASRVPTFLLHVSSGCAPIPCTATMLRVHVSSCLANTVCERVLDGGAGWCGLVGACEWVQHLEARVRFRHGPNLAKQTQLINDQLQRTEDPYHDRQTLIIYRCGEGGVEGEELAFVVQNCAPMNQDLSCGRGSFPFSRTQRVLASKSSRKLTYGLILI